jgi:hypothetical protein
MSEDAKSALTIGVNGVCDFISGSPELPAFPLRHFFRTVLFIWKELSGITRAGLLTCASSKVARIPIPWRTVALERFLGAYSGGAVLDFHQLPKKNACVQLKPLQRNRRFPSAGTYSAV